MYGVGKQTMDDLHLLAIRSDGDLSPTDELMSTDPTTVTYTNMNVTTHSLKEFFQATIFSELNEAFSYLPDKCQECHWEKVYAGGAITNRFSKSNRFNNPSVYCEGLKIFYQEMIKYLISSGVSTEMLKMRLLG